MRTQERFLNTKSKKKLNPENKSITVAGDTQSVRENLILIKMRTIPTKHLPLLKIFHRKVAFLFLFIYSLHDENPSATSLLENCHPDKITIPEAHWTPLHFRNI